MPGNWSLEFLRTESSMQPSATRHRTAPGSIRRIGVRGMRALKWRLHRRKLLTTSSSGCKKQIGTKKKSLITSIIERIFVPNSTTFEERRSTADCLSPTSYAASQALAAQLLEAGSAGIVYPSVRRSGGTCIACFRPVLVTNVQKGERFTFVFADFRTPPTIRRA